VQVVLPTAPRASLGTDLDDSRIPWSAPFTAYIANLPYDVDEEQIKEVFVKCKLKVSSHLVFS
jgi:translation initiation factor 4B